MPRFPKPIQRTAYLKTLILALGLEPKKFMLAVTYKTAAETAVYTWINTLYDRKIPLAQAQERIERAERLYKCYRNTPLTSESRYRYISAS